MGEGSAIGGEPCSADVWCWERFAPARSHPWDMTATRVTVTTAISMSPMVTITAVGAEPIELDHRAAAIVMGGGGTVDIPASPAGVAVMARRRFPAVTAAAVTAAAGMAAAVDIGKSAAALGYGRSGLSMS